MHASAIAHGPALAPNPLFSTNPSIVDEDGLCNWLSRAAAGDSIEYWRGYLAIDASMVASNLRPDDRRQLARLAARAFRLAEQGKAHLVQRCHGPGDYSYVIIAGRPPTAVRRQIHRATAARPIGSAA